MAEPMLISRSAAYTATLDTQDGDEFTVRYQADVQPVIDANKHDQVHNPTGYSPSRELQHVARIPITIQMQWIERYGADPLAKGNEGLLRRILNDPDWRYLRTGGGLI